jgi:glycine betaine/choline ABC-type transport system substrate-binding protein
VYYGKDIINRMHQTGSLDIFLEWLGTMNLFMLKYDEKKKRGEAATTIAIKAGYESSTIRVSKKIFLWYMF